MKEYVVSSPDKPGFEGLISGLIDQGYGSVDNFFDKETLEGLRANLLRHFLKSEMKPAGVGKNFDYKTNAYVRGDLIHWLDPSSTNLFEKRFFDKINDFVAYLNATCYAGINDLEFHYAFYEIGSFYKRHLDQFKRDKGRLFSFVLYLNEDWTPENDGRLSLYLPEGEVVLYPIEGRVAFFRSDQTEHEVHASPNRPRLSIAGWLKKN